MKLSSQWMILGFSLLAALGVYLYVDHALSEQDFKMGKPLPKAPEQALNISVVTVDTSRFAATISASGIVKPRYNLTLISKVSGEVASISPSLQIGRRVTKGTILATLSNPELNSAVAGAQKTLASAELALKEEIRQGKQAQSEWDASGFGKQPDSDLVLRKPQLASAKATVNAAKESLVEAQDNLQHTKIIAPFDALIIKSNLSPGAYLSAGSEVATLYSTDRAEITINLANNDWIKLPSAKRMLSDDWPVKIQDVYSSQSWQGNVINVDQHVDTTTRMRSLIVGLNKPLDQTPALLPGSFITVTLQGQQLANLWQLPNSALSQQGEIWYVDDNKRLATFDTQATFVDSKYIYIKVPPTMRNRPYQILIKPYNSYLKGTLVNPVEQVQE